MQGFLLFILILSGIIAAGSIMLMAPKWWLGVIGGMISWSNEYWSKKSLESTLKKVAIVASIIFVIVCIIYPYVNM